MTAITIPRQYDLTARNAPCSGQSDLKSDFRTVDFFPHKPCGTNRNLNSQITQTSNYAWIFTDATIASNPYPNFLGALLVRSYSNLS